VYLPATPSALAEHQHPADEPLPRGSNQLVLVIDDETAVRKITCHCLKNFGYRVMSASHGAEAAALYARPYQEIDAVITDMMIPIMDGPSTIRVIRTLNASARIIAASGVGTQMDAARARDCGAKTFLPKPYTISGLLVALQEVLGAISD
jgi:CheY-like chemotaxis protein